MNNNGPEYECSECRTTVSLQDKFCKNCGATLEEIANQPENTIHNPPVLSTTSNRNISLPPFKSASVRVKCVCMLLKIFIIIGLATIFSTYAQIELLLQIKQGRPVTLEIAEANDSRQQFIIILCLLIYVTTSIAFLMWIHRAYQNLPALGARGLIHSPGLAISGFFVPILNLFRPFQVVTEIWKASNPEIPLDVSWKTSPSSPIIGQWWCFYLSAWIVSLFTYNSLTEARTLNWYLNNSWIALLIGVLLIIDALLAIKMIKAINERQELKYRTQIINQKILLNDTT